MRSSLLAIVAVWSCACVVLPRPGPPLIRPRPSSDAAALDVYARHRLYVARCGAGSMLSRTDGSYNYYQLRDELGRYPSSRALYEQAARREEGLVFGLAVGLVSIGFAAVDQLQGLGERDSILTGTGHALLYGTGVAVLVGTVIAARLSKDRVPALAGTYNESLRAEVGLTPAQTSLIDASPAPPFKPRCF